MFTTTSNIDPAATGTKEIGGALHGGILPGSLLIIEGSSGSGKSILSMHLAHGALMSGRHIAYYTTDNSCEGLLHKMESFNMQIRHQHLTDLLRVYSLASIRSTIDKYRVFQDFVSHATNLPARFKLIVLDCLTPFIEKLTSRDKVDSFLELKKICGKDRSIILVAHSHVFDKVTHFRVFPMSDYYLRTDSSNKIIAPGLIEERNIKTLELCKHHGIELQKREIIGFEIKPRVGIHILPFRKIQI